MDAPAVAESRLALGAEMGGDDEGAWLAGRAYVAQDFAERLSLGIEGSWAPTAGASWNDRVRVRRRQKGRALAFFAVRTRPGQAEASIAAGFGLSGEGREFEEQSGATRWLTLEPSLAGAAWGSGRIWLASYIALEIEAGLVVTGEPRTQGGPRNHRAVLAPLGRAGLVWRF